MNSLANADFWECFNALPEHIQEQAKRAFALWQADSFHPSLHFKPIKKGNPSVWSVRIGLQYRAIGRRSEIDGQDTITWYWIGPHAEYDKMLDRL